MPLILKAVGLRVNKCSFVFSNGDTVPYILVLKKFL